MRIRLFYLLVICFAGSNLRAQQEQAPRIHAFLDFTAAFGNQEGTASFSYVRNWRLGKMRKLEIGLGARLTSYYGVKREFYTAPANLARSSTVPFVIVFAGHEEQNLDTLTVQRPFTNSLNLSANFGYRFGRKWYAGFNIDLVGFTLGRTTSGILLSNGTTATEPMAKPSSFNVLLTGDNDYGSLNSEFFLKYNVAPRWDIKAVYQFFFTEYNTQSIYQKAPNGTEVYRFRNKANLFGLGVSYDL